MAIPFERCKFEMFVTTCLQKSCLVWFFFVSDCLGSAQYLANMVYKYTVLTVLSFSIVSAMKVRG